MPDYKKRKVKKSFHINKKPKKVKNRDIETFEMNPKEKKKAEKRPVRNLNIVKGKKLERMRKTRITMLSALVLAVAFILVSVFTPVSIFESLGNTLSLIGQGHYPFDLSGSETLNAVSNNGYYHILTDTTLDVRANSGKQVLNISHGFSSPVLKVGSGRALVFDQGGKDLFIINLKEKLTEASVKGDILNADIARNGSYAVAYTSDSHAAVVSVYNRNGKLLYEWYSAEETVNNITISPNGKKIAVSVVTAKGGKLKSKLYVFKYDSANPVYTLDLEDDLVYALQGGNSSGFMLLTKNKFRYIGWSKFKTTEYSNDFELSMFRSGSNGIVLVYSRANNKSDNRIVVLNKRGKLISEFNFNGPISDIQIASGHIYCISDTLVSIFSREGELLRQGECIFGAVRLSVLSGYSVAVIRNDEVSRLEIKK